MTTRALMRRMLAALTPDLTPEVPHTPLIHSSIPPSALSYNSAAVFPNLVNLSTLNDSGELRTVKITATIIEQAIDEIDDDPTAGLGSFTKRQLLVDRLLRIFNTAESSEVTTSKRAVAPLLTQTRKVASRQSVALTKQQASGSGTASDVEATALSF